jgi:FtsP/CotA-like multicopper oxidase with cupredoxin domain
MSTPRLPLVPLAILAAGLFGACGEDIEATTSGIGQIRTYYIAAEEVIWDYAPSGANVITGEPFDEVAQVFTRNGPDRIGTKYVKARYIEYTDGSFTEVKPRPPQWEHLGILGPVVRATVGDAIRFVFKNNTSRPVSVHPHGVFYDKASEGAPYSDGTSGNAKRDDAVPPGEVYTYKWSVPERAGPGPSDGSSVFWMYHSHTDEVADSYAGLEGPLIITARGKARSDGRPIDVDRELVTMFMVHDENHSPYLAQNIEMFAGDPASVDPEDEEFEESNLKHGINGQIYGNLTGLEMRKGERVRWYLMGMGTEVDLHTPHWHGNTTLIDGHRSDVAELLPATLLVADMQPDDVGTWLYHCHVNDHISAGMQALYRVRP